MTAAHFHKRKKRKRGDKNKGSDGITKRKENVKENELKGEHTRIRKEVERNGVWKGKKNNVLKKCKREVNIKD